MSINSITNPLLANLGSITRPDATRSTTDRVLPSGTDRTGASQAPMARPALKTQTPIAGAGTTQHTVPAEPPPGTDPTEERNFFAKSASSGPLTYGRIKAATNPAPPAARGVRLDVRA